MSKTFAQMQADSLAEYRTWHPFTDDPLDRLRHYLSGSVDEHDKNGSRRVLTASGNIDPDNPWTGVTIADLRAIAAELTDYRDAVATTGDETPVTEDVVDHLDAEARAFLNNYLKITRSENVYDVEGIIAELAELGVDDFSTLDAVKWMAILNRHPALKPDDVVEIAIGGRNPRTRRVTAEVRDALRRGERERVDWSTDPVSLRPSDTDAELIEKMIEHYERALNAARGQQKVSGSVQVTYSESVEHEGKQYVVTAVWPPVRREQVLGY